MKKTIATLSAQIGAFVLAAPIAFAVEPINVDPCKPGTVTPGESQTIQQQLCSLNASGTGNLLRSIIVGILVIAAVISLFFLIFGGVKWIMSGGDKTKVGEARSMIVAAIIGLIITFLAYFILSVVLGLFGLNVGNLTLPRLTPQ